MLVTYGDSQMRHKDRQKSPVLLQEIWQPEKSGVSQQIVRADDSISGGEVHACAKME